MSYLIRAISTFSKPVIVVFTKNSLGCSVASIIYDEFIICADMLVEAITTTNRKTSELFTII
jgi:hypothetical protein